MTDVVHRELDRRYGQNQDGCGSTLFVRWWPLMKEWNIPCDCCKQTAERSVYISGVNAKFCLEHFDAFKRLEEEITGAASSAITKSLICALKKMRGGREG